MSDPNINANQIDDQCHMVGGPVDGQTIPLPRSQTEYALPVEAASLLEELGEMLGDLNEKTG
ncbi:MAG TPA: hypothetical protein VMP01_04185 [Pirellulaceae bacterium]|nr:hypothetical protein [Pirellulaceae bacterium]